MKIYQKFIVYNYLKNFFIIFFALELFYVGLDLLTNYHKLPNSANLQILYIMFQAMTAVNYLLPLSIVFAMIVTKFAMIKSNELISMYALGLGKDDLVKPLFVSSMVITVIYIVFNFTPFSYAREYGQNLLKFSQISTNTKDLFLKNGSEYIFFEKLDPIRKIATNIRIFSVKNGDLRYIINAEKGYYKEKNWILYNVVKTVKRKVETLDDSGLEIIKYSTLETLENFKPKIIDNIYNGKFNLSILDAIEALKFFNAQELNTDRIRTIIFSQLFLPVFAPFLVLIFFYKVPMISRYKNLTLISFSLAFITVITWGILFLLNKLSFNLVLLPEIGIMIPMFFLGIYALFIYVRDKKI